MFYFTLSESGLGIWPPTLMSIFQSTRWLLGMKSSNLYITFTQNTHKYFIFHHIQFSFYFSNINMYILVYHTMRQILILGIDASDVSCKEAINWIWNNYFGMMKGWEVDRAPGLHPSCGSTSKYQVRMLPCRWRKKWQGGSHLWLRGVIASFHVAGCLREVDNGDVSLDTTTLRKILRRRQCQNPR